MIIPLALSLAAKFTESHDVTLFFDIEGVKTTAKDAKSIEMKDYMTSKEAL